MDTGIMIVIASGAIATRASEIPMGVGSAMESATAAIRIAGIDTTGGSMIVGEIGEKTGAVDTAAPVVLPVAETGIESMTAVVVIMVMLMSLNRWADGIDDQDMKMNPMARGL
jgi:hypothetical protein